MEINNYSELTDFINSEFIKMQETFPNYKPSKKLMLYLDKSLEKYVEMYSRPLFIELQNEVAFRCALATMPHGFLWKIFHPGLWAKIKAYLKEEKESQEQQANDSPQAKTLIPTIYPKQAPPPIDDEA